MRPLLFTLSIFFYVSVQGQSSGSILHNDLTRTYTYYIPSNSSSAPMPLVFVLHGTTQSGEGIMDISGFNALAETNNFIALYPDGINGFWNIGLATGGSDTDDMGFIEALRNQFVAEYNIDEQRIYSCGFSAGGYMSYKLVCESEYCFAAIASVSGLITETNFSLCNPLHETSIMHIHGTSDFVVSYNGSAQAGIGAESVLDYWTTELGCPSAPVVESLPNTNTFDFSTVEKQQWSPCSNDNEVVLLKIDGGGHQWPGTDALLGGLGNINRDIDASIEIWNFFENHACPASVAIEEKEKTPIEIFPNPSNDNITLILPNDRSVFVRMFDASGREVLRRLIKNNETINLSEIQNGVYYIQPDGYATQRFIKM